MGTGEHFSPHPYPHEFSSHGGGFPLRLNELYARTDQVGFMTTQRVDGRLILPESVKVLKMAGTKAAATTPTTDPDEQPGG